MEHNYYHINEETARRSHELASFSEYKEGTLTSEYRYKVDKVYELADKLAEVRPDDADKGYRIADRYAKRLAANMNRDAEIGTRCPSVMISGSANFPTRKKERQVEAWRSNREDYEAVEKIPDKIRAMIAGKDIIKSGDARAIEKLESKIAELKEQQETMKSANAYYRKNKTLEGFDGMPEKEIREVMADMKRFKWNDDKPFQSYSLTNNNANIKRLEKRLEGLKAEKEAGDSEVEGESGLYTLVTNTEIMRIQFIFSDKPDEQIRSILKENGFRWAPSQSAWQRQLTANGKCAAQKVIAEIKKITEVA